MTKVGRQGKVRYLLSVGAAVGTVAVILSACGSSKSAGSVSTTGLYGALPASNGSSTSGGTMTVGQISGSTPDYIFPIVPEANASVYNDFLFDQYMWTPLYFSPTGSTPAYDPNLSLASAPTFSNGNKTLTIQMKSNYTWSNGAPVDANDVIFFIDLIRQAVKESPANWNNYSPGFLPDNIASVTTPSKYMLVLNLTKAYNPGYYYDDQLDLLYPLPSTSWNIDAVGGAPVDYTQPANAKKIYDFLAAQSKNQGSYASNPLWQVVDGPMKLTSFTPSNGGFTMVPNSTFGGPTKASYSQLKFETFTDYQAEANQLKAGSLDIGQVDQSLLAQVPQIKSEGYSVYGYPDFGLQGAFINFKDTTNDFDKIIAQPYARQALAELVDQPDIVSGVFKGAAAVSYGPVPAIPSSPFTPSNAVKAPYPYSISAASKSLTDHGWDVVPNGQTTCKTPGTGPADCGAGIPAGTKFAFTWVYANTPPTTGQIATAFAAAAKQVGIGVTLNEQTFNNAVQNYDDPAGSAYDNKWGINDFGGFTQSLYPTTNTLFNTGGDFNLGDYSDPTADSLIAASVTGGNASAVTSEASYLTTSLPILFMPNPDYIWAVKNNVHGPANSFMILTQLSGTPEYWYFVK